MYHAMMCDEPLRNRSNRNFRKTPLGNFCFKKISPRKIFADFFGAARWPDSMRVCIRDKYALAQIFALLFASILIIMFKFEVVLLSCVFF